MLLVMVKKPWLPDGAQRLARGEPACERDCVAAMGPNGLIGQIVTVKNGHFAAGPFSFRGAPFVSGNYPVEISFSPDITTASPDELRLMGIVIHNSLIRVGEGVNPPELKSTSKKQPVRPQKLESGQRTSFYESRYQIAGLLLRVAKVCQGDAKRAIDAGFGLLASEELKAMSRAYPQQTQKWMEQGAEKFNTGVMADGIAAACTFAQKVITKAEEIAQADRR
jgi:hypothetical protein